jgi:hypothetical protein
MAESAALQFEAMEDREDSDEGVVAAATEATVEELAVVVTAFRWSWWQWIRCRAMPG